MPSFRWSAINGGGDTVNGVMEAPDRGTVVERLQRQGHLVLRADPASQRRGLSELLQFELGGARMASPGLLSKALAASSLHRRPVIGTVAFHLGPEVQMES